MHVISVNWRHETCRHFLLKPFIHFLKRERLLYLQMLVLKVEVTLYMLHLLDQKISCVEFLSCSCRRLLTEEAMPN